MGIAGVGADYDYQDNICRRTTSADKGTRKNYTKEEMFQMISDRKKEIYEKVKNNDTETSFRIGSQSFTIKEWEKILEQFDLVEEEIKEQMKEEQAKRQKETTAKISVKTAARVTSEDSTDIAKAAGVIAPGGKVAENGIETEEKDISVMDLLVTESTTCTYPASNKGETDKMYITWYTEEGIFCREAGQKEGYLWKIAFDDNTQYEKVMEFLDGVEDSNYQFAARKDFWEKFLKGETDEENVHILNGISIVARYAPDSTVDNPIAEVRVRDANDENAEKISCYVNINEVNPENATPLEIFALCSHADAQGLSKYSVSDRKSYVDLMYYADIDMDHISDFSGKKIDWIEAVEKSRRENNKQADTTWKTTLLDLLRGVGE